MLQVQAASCPYTAACTFSIPCPPIQIRAFARIRFSLIQIPEPVQTSYVNGA